MKMCRAFERRGVYLPAYAKRVDGPVIIARGRHPYR